MQGISLCLWRRNTGYIHETGTTMHAQRGRNSLPVYSNTTTDSLRTLHTIQHLPTDTGKAHEERNTNNEQVFSSCNNEIINLVKKKSLALLALLVVVQLALTAIN